MPNLEQSVTTDKCHLQSHSHWLDEHQGNNFIQALHPSDFSRETDNIKPDVQLYIKLFLVLSVTILTCQATF